MNLISAIVPTAWLVPLWIIALFVLFDALRKARWAMLADRRDLNVFLAATVVILGLWMIKTGVKPGLNFHMLGATLLTLMFRARFALIALGLIVTANTLHNGEFNAFPANFLIMAAVPVGVSWSIYSLADSRLPNHLFIYVFINAFFASALAAFAVGLTSTTFFAVSGAYPLDYLLEEYLPFYFLMAWAEAFATGMMMTLMVVYRPEWVSTFDDRRYLHGK